jgi:hypothetical protein
VNSDQSPREHKSSFQLREVFCAPKKIAPAIYVAGARFRNLFLSLANASASEPPVILHADLTAAEKIGDCSDCFSAALRTRAHSENQVAEGKFFWGFENLFVLFHTISIHF